VERTGRRARQVEIRPLIAGYRIAELEFEVNDVALINRQLAFEGEMYYCPLP
jgi:hypothetical protein